MKHLPTPEAETSRNTSGLERSLIRLEEAQDYLMEQFRKAKTLEDKLKLSNALASNCRALFQGYRAMTLTQGGISPMQQAYNELKALEFDEY
jgi:hypothetical protein